jgi:hypothetical protein
MQSLQVPLGSAPLLEVIEHTLDRTAPTGRSLVLIEQEMFAPLAVQLKDGAATIANPGHLLLAVSSQENRVSSAPIELEHAAKFALPSPSVSKKPQEYPSGLLSL